MFILSDTPYIILYYYYQSKMFEETQKLQNVRQMGSQLSEDLKKKEQLELQLIQKCEQSGKNTNRNWYTKRILEIISNIKKQNGEIQKILEDTVSVQKEINSLNGQVDRSFTLADELIFRVSFCCFVEYKLKCVQHIDISCYPFKL